MSGSAFVNFTRQDGYKLAVRSDSVMAFMPAADVGTLIWFTGAAGADFQHVKDAPAAVAAALGAASESKPEKPAPKAASKKAAG